ncbi:MAG: hypothetical protein ACQESG_07470 [Nanobdellota archaeon]
MKYLLLLTAILILGCQDPAMQKDLLSIAQDAVQDSDTYQEYRGQNLHPVSSPLKANCTGCYRTGLIFETPDLPEFVSNVGATVDIVNGTVESITFQEIKTSDAPTIKDYYSCVDAGYKHDENTCETLEHTFKKKFCKDQCGDGYCEEIVCMGEGCPCPESEETCPKDCLK